jgi:LPXTG-motif cell wall-anchored protein
MAEHTNAGQAQWFCICRGEEGRAMRRSIIAAAVAAALLTGWALPSAAQQNGVVIQNNGVDSSDSAAGADNVRISNSPGSGASLSGGGLNNEIGTTKDRNRKDRGARDNAEAAPAEEYAAPAEEYAAPTEDEYQAYADEGSVEPVPAVEESIVDPTTQQSTHQVLKLPSTGAGFTSSMSLAAAAGVAALALGAMSLRRRLLT